jgi:superfamily II DNA/RNA helicase
VAVVVLDEADEMMDDMGFAEDIESILGRRRCQILCRRVGRT